MVMVVKVAVVVKVVLLCMRCVFLVVPVVAMGQQYPKSLKSTYGYLS